MKNIAADWYLPLKGKYPNVAHEEWVLLTKSAKTKVIKKSECFLPLGKVAHSAAFVISGQFAFTIVDG